MAELIATGTTDLDSSEFTLASFDVATLSLKSSFNPDPPQGAEAVIYLKTSAGTFLRIGKLNEATPVQVLSAPGTYKITRRACANSFGVDKV